MSEEPIVEPRTEAPAGRAQSPLWKWAFLVTLMTLGMGSMAAVLLSGLEPPAPPPEEEGRPRLRFNLAAYELPEFPKPAPVSEPEPVPGPVVPAHPEGASPPP